MYLSNRKGGMYYDSSGQQHSRRAPFLILMECRDRDGVSAIVRQVALRQLGHWMMGSARIGRKRYTLSGCYGADGLLREVDSDAWDRGIKLPNDVYNLWKNDNGHNSCGSNGEAIRNWARELFQIS